MRNVEIELFQIAKTCVDREEVKRWTDFLGANEFEVPDEEEITNPALLIAVAAKRCYNSFQNGLNPNVTRVRKDWTEYIDNILKSGHGSVCEHSAYTYAIENVSRVFSGEMNRHRAGVGISEASMRYIRFDPEIDEHGNPKPGTGIAWWLPLSLRPEPEKISGGDIDTLPAANPAYNAAVEDKKQRSREVFNRHWEMTEKNYTELLAIWRDEMAPESKFHLKKQLTSCFRRIIGMGVATGGVWTMNIRAIRHILAMRATAAAEEEIAHVFTRIAKMMVEQEPMLMGDFKQTPDGFWVPTYWKV